MKKYIISVLILLLVLACTPEEPLCFEHYETYWDDYTLRTIYTYSYDCITYFTRHY